MVKTNINSNKRKVIPRVSKQNISYKPVQKNMNRFVKDMSGPLSKAEVCIGHALSNTYGFSLYGAMDNFLDSKPVSSADILDHIRWYSKNPIDKIFYVQTYAINGHSTIICMKKSIDGILNLWYMNPWGYGNDYSHIEWVGDVVEKELSNGYIDGTLDPPESVEDAMKSTNEEEDYEDERSNMSTSIKFINFMENTAKYPMLRSGNIEIPKYHPTNMLRAMCLLVNDEHPFKFKVIEDSMPFSGIQLVSRDGSFRTNGKFSYLRAIMGQTGSCVVWTEMYIRWITALLSESDQSQDSIEEIISIIGVKPALLDCDQMEQAVETLGRFFYNEISKILSGKRRSTRDAHLPETNFKPILEILVPVLKSVFDEMPSFSDSERGVRLAVRYQEYIEKRFEQYFDKVTFSRDKSADMLESSNVSEVEAFVAKKNRRIKKFLIACNLPESSSLFPTLDIGELHAINKCIRCVLIMSNCKYNIGKRPLMSK